MWTFGSSLLHSSETTVFYQVQNASKIPMVYSSNDVLSVCFIYWLYKYSRNIAKIRSNSKLFLCEKIEKISTVPLADFDECTFKQHLQLPLSIHGFVVMLVSKTSMWRAKTWAIALNYMHSLWSTEIEIPFK